MNLNTCDTPGLARMAPIGDGIPRAVEAVLAILGLTMALPILILAAIAIRLTSSGAILFRQKRIGLAGRPFTLFKFRTMRESGSGAGITAAGDNRVTPVGHILRGTKIDELPELWNVLIGDMSFVGPRPELPRYVDIDDALWCAVLQARPGVTDPVTLRLRNEEALLSRVQDPEAFYVGRLQPLKLRGYLKYLQIRTPWQDVRVILTTLLASVFPKTVPAPTVREILASIESSVLEDHHSDALKWGTIQARLAQTAVDLSLLAASFVFGYLLRYDFAVPSTEIPNLTFQLPLVIMLQFALLSALGLSRVIWRYVGVSDLSLFAKAFVWSMVLLLALRFGLTRQHQEFRIPMSIIAIDALLAFVALTGVRLLRRIRYEEASQRESAAKLDDIGPGRHIRNAVIVGAGRAGIMTAREILSRGDLDYAVIGFVDDDVHKVGAVIQGLRVLGTTEDLPRIVRERNVNEIIVSIAGQSREVGDRVRELCDPSQVNIVEMPGMLELVAAAQTRAS
jgi:lipopolysaccharide/colanic/teichoic acid biosynthesis glycosyltransferase